MYLAFIGLGSNLPLKTKNHAVSSQQLLVQAIAQLTTDVQAVNVPRCMQVASLYQTKPVGGPSNQPDYLNTVVSVYTYLEPLDLLAALQIIEKKAGRERLEHWGARTLDLDVLLLYKHVNNTPNQLMNSQQPPVIIHNETLTVPHPWLMQRSFVLLPLLELEPQLTVNNILLSELPTAVDNTLLKIADATQSLWWMPLE